MKHCPNSECSHLEETGRAGEYRDDIAQCSDCGTALAAGEPPEMDRPGQVRWEAIMEVPDQHMAHLVKSALAMEGIHSELRPVGKSGGSLVPGQQGKAEVIVPDHLAAAAREIISARSGAPVPLPEGEDLEFVDADGMPLAHEEEDHSAGESMADVGDEIGMEPGDEETPAVVTSSRATQTGSTCPRCSSSGVTSIPPEDPAASGGFFKRVFQSRATRMCQSCQHRW
jgi:hypothetical protein